MLSGHLNLIKVITYNLQFKTMSFGINVKGILNTFYWLNHSSYATFHYPRKPIQRNQFLIKEITCNESDA